MTPVGGPRYPWVAMGIVLTGSLMVILDTTIVNVALPRWGWTWGLPMASRAVATSALPAEPAPPGVGTPDAAA